MAKVHVIHENGVWVEPLRTAFNELGTPYEEWFLDRGVLDLRGPPPEGVFYNRMSASSHTRDHRYAAEYTGAVLAWLECHGRLVVNDSRALRLEISKVAQYEALGAFGIPTRTRWRSSARRASSRRRSGSAFRSSSSTTAAARVSASACS